MNEYEILLLLDPDLDDDRQAEIVTRTRELVERGGGTWDLHDVWGRRKLAYEIGHKGEGSYHLLHFTSDAGTLDEVSRVLRIDDGVMRHLATRRIEGSPVRPVAVAAPSARGCSRRIRRRGRGGVAMAGNINRVVLVGNLTRDPELRHTPSGTPVCSLRLAVNTRRKDETGQWMDKPNYFDITVWGQQGENCAQYLSKGRPVAVDGRLEWREWEAQDGAKRQAVEVVAESVQFLGGRQDGESSYVPAGATAAGGDDFPTSPTDDDIPF